MRRILHLVIALVLTCAAAAQDVQPRDAVLGPLPIRDQFLLSNGFLSFRPETPRALDDDTWSVSFVAADANTFAKSGWISHSLAGRTSRSGALQTLADTRFQSVDALFLVDGEIHRSDLIVSRGFGHGLELRASLPLIRTGGGWSDRVIESVHHMLNIGNAQRESLRRNTETVYLRHDGLTYVRARGTGMSLGDASLTAKYELIPMEEQHTSLAVVSTVEFPTGNARTLDGSGSVDAGVELVAARDFDRTRINASLAIIALGANSALGLRRQYLIADTVGIAHRVAESTAVIAQLTVSESPFRQIGVPEFSRRCYQLSTGVQRQFGRYLVHAALIENVVSFENSADAGLAWGISRRF